MTKNRCCCERVGTLEWGRYSCRHCGGHSCYFHVALWPHGVPYCYFCFNRTEVARRPVSIPYVTNTASHALTRKALLIIDGLYVAGMQRHCLDLLDVFMECGYGCTVVTLDGAGGKWADRFLEKSELIVLDSEGALTWERLLNIADFRNFDFAVAHLTHPVAWAAANVPEHVRTIAHFHSEFSEHEAISVEVLHEVGRRFDTVLFPSDTTRDHYRRFLLSFQNQATDFTKWKVLPNAVPRFMTDSLCVSNEPSPDTLRVAVISRLDHDKLSIPLFITTLKHLLLQGVSFSVDVAGDGEGRHELEAAVIENGLASYVNLLGFVEDIHRIYANSHIVFLPSKRESMPYVMLESISFRRPIVMPRVGLLTSVVPSNLVNAFEPQDSAQAASIIAAKWRQLQGGLHDFSADRHVGLLDYEDWASLVKKAYRL